MLGIVVLWWMAPSWYVCTKGDGTPQLIIPYIFVNHGIHKADVTSLPRPLCAIVEPLSLSHNAVALLHVQAFPGGSSPQNTIYRTRQAMTNSTIQESLVSTPEPPTKATSKHWTQDNRGVSAPGRSPPPFLAGVFRIEMPITCEFRERASSKGELQPYFHHFYKSLIIILLSIKKNDPALSKFCFA